MYRVTEHKLGSEIQTSMYAQWLFFQGQEKGYK